MDITSKLWCRRKSCTECRVCAQSHRSLFYTLETDAYGTTVHLCVTPQTKYHASKQRENVLWLGCAQNRPGVTSHTGTKHGIWQIKAANILPLHAEDWYDSMVKVGLYPFQIPRDTDTDTHTHMHTLQHSSARRLPVECRTVPPVTCLILVPEVLPSPENQI